MVHHKSKKVVHLTQPCSQKTSQQYTRSGSAFKVQHLVLGNRSRLEAKFRVRYLFLLNEGYLMHQPKPVVLIILDGWGHQKPHAANAITHAKTPHWNALWEKAPHALLSASGLDVGLPEGQMGNSEVGHLNIGAGRIIYQDSTRISASITEGSFFTNPVLLQALEKVQHQHGRMHLLGLLSDGGVHSLQAHAHALLKLCQQHRVPSLFHAFLDGRDTPPKSAESYLQLLNEALSHYPLAKIGSIMGRYYAMDRDNRWDRVQKAYECLTAGRGHIAANALAGLQAAYDRGQSDEFVEPTWMKGAVPIQPNDGIIFFNFRADRARELTEALIAPDFSAFKRSSCLPLSTFVSLTEYAPTLQTEVAFAPTSHQKVLGALLAEKHLTQLRLAETEKYAHVTFFFNGGNETPFKGESRQLIPSPLVSTYDQKPEMSAPEITDVLVDAIEKRSFDVIICNYANADMVGHTGNFKATCQAVETIDACLGRVLKSLQAVNGAALITADHGNADNLYDTQTQQAHTAHTTAPVPLVYIGNRGARLKERGRLCDVAPTLLQLLNISQPSEMTGKPLLLWSDEL